MEIDEEHKYLQKHEIDKRIRKFMEKYTQEVSRQIELNARVLCRDLDNIWFKMKDWEW